MEAGSFLRLKSDGTILVPYEMKVKGAKKPDLGMFPVEGDKKGHKVLFVLVEKEIKRYRMCLASIREVLEDGELTDTDKIGLALDFSRAGSKA